MPQLETIQDALRHLPDAPIATSRNRLWSGLTVDVHAGVADFELDAPPLDHHLVVYTPYGTGRMLQRRAGRAYESVHRAGSIIVMPAGQECSWRGIATPTVRLRMRPDLLAEAAEQVGKKAGARPELLNVFHTRDNLIAQLATMFQAEIEKPEHPSQHLIVDSATTILCAHLLRSYDAFGAKCIDSAHGLGPGALRRVISYVEDHYETPIRLDDLARLANVSRFHFARMFKASTGLTAMEYLEQTRLTRAQALIRTGRFSLASIASSVGFSDQSHFTRRFGRFVNCTPAVYARNFAPCKLPSP